MEPGPVSAYARTWWLQHSLLDAGPHRSPGAPRCGCGCCRWRGPRFLHTVPTPRPGSGTGSCDVTFVSQPRRLISFCLEALMVFPFGITCISLKLPRSFASKWGDPRVYPGRRACPGAKEGAINNDLGTVSTSQDFLEMGSWGHSVYNRLLTFLVLYPVGELAGPRPSPHAEPTA